jgi:hypothetical protein
MGGMTDTKTIRIGNGQGFWGDSPDTPWEMISRGPVDYLTLDYLAEVTMSIMMRQKLRDPSRGYATDFITFLERALPMLHARKIKVVTNAGGLNPSACRDRIAEIAGRIGVWGLKVGVVEGDDILPRLDEILAAGHPLANMDTGTPLAELTSKVLSANVYLGARPVAKALDLGADIVVAGRITDTSLALGPLVHEFGWAADDWDRLASGVIAGHILECGAQATGGNFTRWWEVPDMWDVGYPVVECVPDGSFVVTKHVGTGGLVTAATVSEQLLYEMGRPDGYITPDVVADFTSVGLTDQGDDRVLVDGIRGAPFTPTYKVSATYQDGYKAVGHLTVSGPRAMEKARLCADMVWKRLLRAGIAVPPEDRVVELVGSGACLPGILDAGSEPPEIVLRLGMRSRDRRKTVRFAQELAPLITSGPPGVTGFAGGRPPSQDVVAYWPALLDKKVVDPFLRVTVEAV